jgi:hypothetical protein
VGANTSLLSPKITADQTKTVIWRTFKGQDKLNNKSNNGPELSWKRPSPPWNMKHESKNVAFVTKCKFAVALETAVLY